MATARLGTGMGCVLCRISGGVRCDTAYAGRAASARTRAHLPDRSARLLIGPTRLSPTTSAWEHSRWDSSAAALLQGTNRQGGFARTDTTRGHLSTCLSPGVSQTVITTHRVKRRERRFVGPARLRSSTSQSFSPAMTWRSATQVDCSRPSHRSYGITNSSGRQAVRPRIDSDTARPAL